MTRLPAISGRELARMLMKIGYAFDRQRGSHMILRQTNSPYRRITVPDHDEISRGTLRAIIRQAGLTIEEFVDLR